MGRDADAWVVQGKGASKDDVKPWRAFCRAHLWCYAQSLDSLVSLRNLVIACAGDHRLIPSPSCVVLLLRGWFSIKSHLQAIHGSWLFSAPVAGWCHRILNQVCGTGSHSQWFDGDARGTCCCQHSWRLLGADSDFIALLFSRKSLLEGLIAFVLLSLLLCLSQIDLRSRMKAWRQGQEVSESVNLLPESCVRIMQQASDVVCNDPRQSLRARVQSCWDKVPCHLSLGLCSSISYPPLLLGLPKHMEAEGC